MLAHLKDLGFPSENVNYLQALDMLVDEEHENFPTDSKCYMKQVKRSKFQGRTEQDRIGENTTHTYEEHGVRMNLSLTANCELFSRLNSRKLDALGCAYLSTKSRLKQLAARTQFFVAASSGGSIDFSLSSWFSGLCYNARLAVGTPPRYVSLLIDTGSDFSWLQCRPCNECISQDDPVFNPRTSQTYREVSCRERKCYLMENRSRRCRTPFGSPCQYRNPYPDGTWSIGTLAEEVFSLGGAGIQARLAFGCGYNNSGNFGSSAGILGLGRGGVSFASQMRTQLGYSSFTTCFTSVLRSTQTGYLHFGDFSAKSNSMKYTPMLSGGSGVPYYYVRLEKITVGGKLLDIPDNMFEATGGTILDTGSTITALNSEAFTKLKQVVRSTVKLNETASDDYNLCFSIHQEELEPRGTVFRILPGMEFWLAAGAKLDLSPQQVFYLSDDGNKVCLAIMENDGAPFNVIGVFQQQDTRIVYDLENGRIGFARAKC